MGTVSLSTQPTKQEKIYIDIITNFIRQSEIVINLFRI